MKILNGIKNLAMRLLTGEDIVLVRQGKAQWDRQFRLGRWDGLNQHSPNTSLVAGIISKRIFKAKDRLRILDVGCGNGALTRLIAGSLDRIEYLGTDLSEEAIAAAKEAVPGAGFIAAPAEAPPEDLGIYDLIVFHEVFYYIDPADILPRYQQYLAPEGAVIISVVRSWRSAPLWSRIKRHLMFTEEYFVRDITLDNAFDIVVGTYKNPSV
jgi:2-polyprenyl-3-methyl-5-hydroxy-6-metoxy-1,4-benzoquinol methylase